MQKCIYISVIVLLSINTLKAQNCLQDFKKEVALYYASKDDIFTKEAKRLVLSTFDNLKPDSTKLINIPVIYSTRKAVKLFQNGEVDKSNFFCYLDASSISFDESIIIQDSAFVGIILPSPNPSLKFEYVKFVDDYRKTIAEEIIRINPEVIFTIYNIPRCYWYVKGTELYVLAEQNNVFISYKATDYLRDYLTEEQISFLYYKNVVVIGGK